MRKPSLLRVVLSGFYTENGDKMSHVITGYFAQFTRRLTSGRPHKNFVNLGRPVDKTGKIEAGKEVRSTVLTVVFWDNWRNWDEWKICLQ
ncbi:MAG: hypothetical protein ACRCUY_06430 [Thermoguttaceae bacterium]